MVWSSAFCHDTNPSLLFYCQCCAYSVIEEFIAAIIYKNKYNYSYNTQLCPVSGHLGLKLHFCIYPLQWYHLHSHYSTLHPRQNYWYILLLFLRNLSHCPCLSLSVCVFVCQERAWLCEVYTGVCDWLHPAVGVSLGMSEEQLAHAVVLRLQRTHHSLPVSYRWGAVVCVCVSVSGVCLCVRAAIRPWGVCVCVCIRFISVAQLISTQRMSCFSSLTWSTSQHREWTRKVEPHLPSHKALPRANLILIGLLCDRRVSAQCDGFWRVRDSSGSVHCEVLVYPFCVCVCVKVEERETDTLCPVFVRSWAHHRSGSGGWCSSPPGTTFPTVHQGRDSKLKAAWSWSTLLSVWPLTLQHLIPEGHWVMSLGSRRQPDCWDRREWD